MSTDSAALRQLARTVGGRNPTFAQFADGLIERLEAVEASVEDVQASQSTGYVGWGFLCRATSTLANMPLQAPNVSENRGSGVEIATFTVGHTTCHGFVLAPGLYNVEPSMGAKARMHDAFPASSEMVAKMGVPAKPFIAPSKVTRLWFYPDGSTEPHLSCQVRRLA